MSEPVLPFFSRLRLRACNLLIAALLALILLDGLPTTPKPVRELIDPAVDRLGISQGPWQLFSPNPDGQNHRFRAEISYHDGAQHEWRSPVWRQLSASERFHSHRESEYLDHVWGVANEPAWAPWADHLAAMHRTSDQQGSRPREVRMIIEIGDVPPPADGPWPPIDKATDFRDSWVLFTKKYP